MFDASKGERFSANKNIKHRKLLWHGTNVAVIAAILKSGLRIMPHSGGRVGKGIYFASENAKSACYGKTQLVPNCARCPSIRYPVAESFGNVVKLSVSA